MPVGKSHVSTFANLLTHNDDGRLLKAFGIAYASTTVPRLLLSLGSKRKQTRQSVLIAVRLPFCICPQILSHTHYLRISSDVEVLIVYKTDSDDFDGFIVSP